MEFTSIMLTLMFSNDSITHKHCFPIPVEFCVQLTKYIDACYNVRTVFLFKTDYI